MVSWFLAPRALNVFSTKLASDNHMVYWSLAFRTVNCNEVRKRSFWRSMFLLPSILKTGTLRTYGSEDTLSVDDICWTFQTFGLLTHVVLRSRAMQSRKMLTRKAFPGLV
jgi:hypothetical protein